MLLNSVLVPIVMIIAGYMMRKHPPRKINWIFGYRTQRSMKNEETWAFAHALCGRLCWKIGWIAFAVSAFAMLAFVKASENAVAIASLVLMFAQLVVLIASILPVERALKNTFHDDGTRK